MSHATRRSLVFTCIIALLAIVGMMVYSVSGAFVAPPLAVAGAPAASQSGPLAPIDAGPAPLVTIDDPSTHVTIGLSSDGKVHVSDQFDVHGWVSGRHEAVRVNASGDHVDVMRARGSDLFVFGSVFTRLNVLLPAGARIAVTNSDGLEIRDAGADLNVRSSDRIYLTSVKSPRIIAHSTYGRLYFTDVQAEQIDAHTRFGKIFIDGLTMSGETPHAVFTSDDGSIEATATFPAAGTYTLHTHDGKVHLRVPATNNLTIDASTADGRIHAERAFAMTGDDRHHQIATLGSGAAKVSLSSDDGSIYLETTGAL